MTDNPSFLSQSLPISLSASSLSSPLPFLIFLSLFSFQQALSSPSCLSHSLSALFFNSLCLSFCLSLCFYLPVPLLNFIFPKSLHLSVFLSVTSCHLGGPDSSVDVEEERRLTILSLTPGVRQAEARPWAGISVTVTMQSWHLTVQFGKLTGFTALVQQWQTFGRTQEP